MKTTIHPAFFSDKKVICSCGNSFITGSTVTLPEIRVESCQKCHPFYTGEKRLLKTSRVESFYARQKKSAAISGK